MMQRPEDPATQEALWALIRDTEQHVGETGQRLQALERQILDLQRRVRHQRWMNRGVAAISGFLGALLSAWLLR